MDHAEAMRIEAAVKYVLGELPESLRDEYEEHYFDCAVCAFDVKAAAQLVDGARETLRQREHEEFRAKVTAPAQPGLFAWFRPALALPAFVALLLFAGYQTFLTIPRARNTAPKAMAQVSNTFSLLGANARGAKGITVEIRRDEGVSLTDIDILPSPSFDAYVARLVDASGNTLLQTGISADQAKSSVGFSLPPGSITRPGVYAVVVTGDPGARGQVIPQNEVLRLSFTVAFRQ